MSDIAKTIAQAIFDEIERAKLCCEPGLSLSRFESVIGAVVEADRAKKMIFTRIEPLKSSEDRYAELQRIYNVCRSTGKLP